MFTMILLLYLQRHLEVMLDSGNLRGQFTSMAACKAAAVRQRGPLPAPAGCAAAWHVVRVSMAGGVTVNPGQSPDPGRLLQARPPASCAGDGAWHRVAQRCMAAARGPPRRQSGLN